MASDCHFHHFLVSAELGGAGNTALGLARWLRDDGRTVRVWVPASGPAADAVTNDGLRQSRYPLGLMDRGPLGRLLGTPLLLARLCGRRGLAHIHSPPAFRAIGPALRLARLRTVAHVQIAPGSGEIAWAFRSPPDLVITCARFLVPIVRADLGESRAHIPVVAVPNAVGIDRFSPGNRRQSKQILGAPPDRPLLLMLANLAPHKGQETAIQAVAILRERGIEVECWLAGVERDGSGRYERRLWALVRELGLAGQIRFLGSRADAPLLLRAADFLLLPSTHEGLPLTILEAQASAVPVLAAPTDGIPEVVHDGETGFLIAAADAGGYADRIQSLWNNPHLTRQITERALTIVRREYSWETYCRRIGQLYEDVLTATPYPADGSHTLRQSKSTGPPEAVERERGCGSE
jgi:glycosyltransferase involved in cell wall biosynthesis